MLCLRRLSNQSIDDATSMNQAVFSMTGLLAAIVVVAICLALF